MVVLAVMEDIRITLRDDSHRNHEYGKRSSDEYSQ